MLSHLDSIIFPDRCEVIEIAPSQRYVYPIFKNGSSSLYQHVNKYKCRILINEQIKKLSSIDIFLRDPQERFNSGINTFIQMTLRDHPGLDRHTVSWFAQNYLFLNRHYAPQFLWLVNLARYTNPDAKLNFLSVDQLKQVTDINVKPGGISPISEELGNQVSDIPNNQMYQRIDQILINCIGQSVQFNQLIQYIQQQDPTAYDWVIGRSQQILNPTYVLSKT
jgi:hypothetical protein